MEWKFLEIAAGDRDVLLNSSQFAASTLLAETKRIDGGMPCMERVASFGGVEAFVLDLQAYLSSLFSFPPVQERSEAIVVDIAGLSDRIRQTFGSYVERLDRPVSTARLLVRIGGALRLATIPLSQLKLLPSGIRARSRSGGVVAVRFGLGGRLQYLLDLETIVAGSLAGE